jgi:hypothetical protein
MTQTYFIGGKDTEFALVGGAILTTGGNFRSGYAQCAMQLPSQYSSPTGLSAYFAALNAFSTPVGSFWMTARCLDNSSAAGYATGSSKGWLVRWFDSNNLPRLQVAATISGGTSNSLSTMILQTIDSAGVITNVANSTTGFNSGYLAKLDFHVDMANGFSMYVDTIQVMSYSGALVTNGVTTLTGVALGQSAMIGTGSGASSGGTYWSEIAIADSDTRSCSVYALTISGAGLDSQWTGNAAGTSVTNIPVVDSGGISSNTAGQIELFTTTNATFTDPYVWSVGVVARAMTSNGAPQHIQLALEKGGTVYTSNTANVANSFGMVQAIWNTDPSTSAFWANTNSLQIGVKSIT